MILPVNVEDRLSFLVRIPCHEGEEGISRALLNGNENDSVNDGNKPVNDPVNGKNDPVNDLVKGEETLEKNLHSVYNIINGSPSATYSDIANQLNKSIATVKRNLQKLKEFGIIKREGADKTGRWIILK